MYWCRACNVPLVSRECSKCGGDGDPLWLTPPGDARPAFEHDEALLAEAVRNEFGTAKAFRVLRGRSVMLVNKVPFMDEMKEVVIDGAIVGKYYLEPETLRWRFRLAYAGAQRLVEAGLGDLANATDVGSPNVVRRSRFVRIGRELEPGEQVLLLHNGRPLALGYYVGDGKVSVHQVFARDNATTHASRPSTREDLLRANEYALYVKESRAKAFIHSMSRKVRKPVLVSYSGGKDSLVALDLTLAADVGPVGLLFNDTGIELPETLESVERAAERYGLSPVVSSAGDRFWSSVMKLGPPGRDYRWCCKVVKLSPLASTVRAAWPEGALNVVAQRAFESLDRARNPRVWRHKWIPSLLNISPIQDWGQLDVWLYIWRHGLRVNPLYFKGYDRIGCFLCPASTLGEFHVVRSSHPELWSRWCNVLEWWRRRLGLPPEWVSHGLWRWFSPAAQKRRMERRLGLTLPPWYEVYKGFESPKVRSVRFGEDFVEFAFETPLVIDSVVGQHAVISPDIVRMGRRLIIHGENSIVELEEPFDTLLVRAREGCTKAGFLEEAFDTLKLIYRWYNCTKCGLCVSNCPSGSIRVEPKPAVNANTCLSCRLCVDNCPVADVYVEHVVIARIIGRLDAWRRPTRRRREEVMEVARRLAAGKCVLEGGGRGARGGGGSRASRSTAGDYDIGSFLSQGAAS